jgi:hypothetical protein
MEKMVIWRMSAHDVIKQSSRIAGIMNERNNNVKHKVGEILLEVIIIVFAITLSLFFERWRQNVEDHELEHTFLQGLRGDLSRDVNLLEAASAKWAQMGNATHYFIKPENQINWSQDSIDYWGRQCFHNVYFFPSTNRYEALKSTGKINVIEDKRLQDDIVDLYQTKIPDLEQQLNFFNTFANSQVMSYLANNLKRDENNNAILDKAFFTDVRMRNLLSFYSIDDILKRADSTISKSKRILQEVDENLK